MKVDGKRIRSIWLEPDGWSVSTHAGAKEDLAVEAIAGTHSRLRC